MRIRVGFAMLNVHFSRASDLELRGNPPTLRLMPIRR